MKDFSVALIKSEFRVDSRTLAPFLDQRHRTILELLDKYPKDFEELNQYQAMNPPNLPISKMDENEKEELLVNLVRQTKRILKG